MLSSQNQKAYLAKMIRSGKTLLLVICIALSARAQGPFLLQSTNPSRNAQSVPRNQTIELTFTDAIDPSTLQGSLMVTSLLKGTVQGTLSANGTVIQFDPTEDFMYADRITVTVHPSLQSASATPLTTPAVLRFRTAIATPESDPPVFKGTTIYQSPDGNPYINVPVDFDLDGDVDVVAGRSWFRNDGPNQLTFLELIPDLYLNSIAVTDLENDGDLDLVTGSNYHGVRIFINDGSMQFTSLRLTGLNINATTVDVADFDSNGLVDILWSRDFSPTTIFFQQTGYVFTAQVINPKRADESIIVDMDKDGDWDVVQRDFEEARYLKNVAGLFEEIILSSTTTRDLSVGDFENDGDMDLAIMDDDGLHIFENDGLQQFTPKNVHQPDALFESLDADGDGDTDIVMPGYPKMILLINDGDNNFNSVVIGGAPEGFSFSPNSITPADTDNDGDIDYAISMNYSQIIHYENAALHEVNPFTDVGIIPQVAHGASDWGDFDNDDDLDLLINGKLNGLPVTKLYVNNAGSLTEATTSFLGTYNGSVDWGDFDLDDDLDILIMGATQASPDNGAPQTLVYRNDGGTFTLLPTYIPGGIRGRAAWGDFNNDRLLDIVVFAEGAYAIFQSMGGGNFESRYELMPVASEATLDLADYDADGDLDLAISAYAFDETLGVWLRVLRNNGDWTFTKIGWPLLGLRGDVTWTDADNDGDLDLLASGRTWISASFAVYFNENGDFTKNETQPPWSFDNGVTMSSGDLDNDGFADALVSAPGHRILMLRNDRQGTYSVDARELPNLYSRGTSLGDYDNDGDLDGYASTLLQNNSPTSNTKPFPPSEFSVDSVFNNIVYLSCSEGTDTETAKPGLTYEVYAGTLPQTQNVVSADANLVTGKRKLAARGKLGGPPKQLEGLSGGLYYLGVQSVDASFEGSVFTHEVQVTMIRINGTSGGCQGLSQSYTANPPGNYDWEIKGGIITAGQGTGSIHVRWNDLGQGYVKVSDDLGNKNTLVVNIEPEPSAVIEGPVTVCTGLTTYTLNNPKTGHAIWTTSSNQPVSNPSTSGAEITWGLPGAHKVFVQVFPEHKGCEKRDTLNVDVDIRPNPQITGPLEVCTGWQVTYETQATNPHWEIVRGTIVGNSSSATLTVNWTTSGNGEIKVTEVSSKGYCTITKAEPVSIYQGIPKPVIIQRGDTLLSSPSPSGYYEWYLDGTLVISGPYYGLITNIPGIYQVVVFAENGCGAVSNPHDYLVAPPPPPPNPITAVDPDVKDGLVIYPNPARSSLTIELSNASDGAYNVSVLSSTGSLLKSQVIQSDGTTLRASIDVSELASGLYFVTVGRGNTTCLARFLKQ